MEIKEIMRVDFGQIDKKTQAKPVGFHSKLLVWPLSEPIESVRQGEELIIETLNVKQNAWLMK